MHGEMKNVYKVFSERPEGLIQFQTPMRRLQNNNGMDIKEYDVNV